MRAAPAADQDQTEAAAPAWSDTESEGTGFHSYVNDWQSGQFLGGEEESGSDDDEDTEGDDGSEGMEIDEDEGQGGRQPVVDADGWEVVQRKGR